jgi:transposase-like protein
MNLGSLSRLPSKCPHSGCSQNSESLISGRFSRNGCYHRSSDSRDIQRFRCLECRRSFSSASFSKCKGQKKRRLNHPLFLLLNSGVSQRRAAQLLRTTRATIKRKFLFLALQARLAHQGFLENMKNKTPLATVYFDEMESFERSKCLPVSIPMVVTKERRILSFRVCSMPAKGLLAAISRRKYGLRKNERAAAAKMVWKEVKPILSEDVLIISDENPHYPHWIFSQIKKAKHRTYKGRRGCVVGQGELKRGGFDPLFAFNHTAAMLRANINRLFRRTWCTTKLKERLEVDLPRFSRHKKYVITGTQKVGKNETKELYSRV